MTPKQLISESPAFHMKGDRPVSLGLSAEALRIIDDAVAEGSMTLETGAGISTVLFALKRTTHFCIVPDPALISRIGQYCTSRGISLDRVTYRVERSEEALPRLTEDGFDLALIDGRHAFPSAAIDWYYIAPRLKCGGLVVLDDTHLWSCACLRDFLRQEPEWRLEKQTLRTAVFRKSAEVRHEREWNSQPYVVRRSIRLMWLYRVRSGLQLIQEGKLKDLLTKIKGVRV